MIEKRSLLLLGCAFCAFFLLLTPLDRFHPTIPNEAHTAFFSLIHFDPCADDCGHYAYLPSLIFDRDIDFLNEPFGVNQALNEDTGYVSNAWPIGAAILWAPFFMIGHCLAWIFSFFGTELRLDGYSFPYVAMVGIGTMAYSLLGLVLYYRSLRFFFSEKASLYTVCGVFFTTIIAYYTYVRPFLDIALEFFLLSLFIYLFVLFAVKHIRTPWFCLFLGGVIGLMSITRFNGILYATALPVFLVLEWIGAKDRVYEWKRALYPFLFLACGFLLAISPQLMVQESLYGSIFSFGPASGDVNFPVFSLHTYIQRLQAVFFGGTGILWQSPVSWFGAVGYVIVFWKFRTVSRNKICFYASLLFVFLVQVFLVARLRHFGNAYGIKFLASSILLFGFGIAELARRISGRKCHIAATAILCALVSSQYIQIVEYKIVVSYDKFSVFDVPELFKVILERQPSLLLRSSNFVNLLRLGVSPFSSWLHVYFMLFLPFFLVGTALFLIWKMNMLIDLFKMRSAVVAIFLSFIVLALYLYSQDSLSRQTIERRLALVKEVQSHQSKFIQMQFIMQDYRLGIKPKDDMYRQIKNVLDQSFESPVLQLK